MSGYAAVQYENNAQFQQHKYLQKNIFKKGAGSDGQSKLQSSQAVDESLLSAACSLLKVTADNWGIESGAVNILLQTPA